MSVFKLKKTNIKNEKVKKLSKKKAFWENDFTTYLSQGE